ncbi:hypothetical protein M758_3G017200 [Ceratodon purpureus]|uniref:Peptidyl-prolyl cis-trans isomerase n=1 Tax=Ceratodon purpureus TaxID=3225 RepID=A0A8T0IH74_CERPU|nr:hypothetical protein KC19_3G017400 [Ceratodon purpureus]KAG0621400.1 hypothetical protein M758_3G017200 [Ceratodon purpureus]
MGRMKPAALLQQSKKKKGPARLNVATIVVVGVVVILLLVSTVVLHRRKSRENMTGSEAYQNSNFEDKDMFDGTAEQRATKEQAKSLHFPRYAIMNTTKGSMTIELFGNDAPLTVENFITHSKKGYYNGLSFHRVIKNFIIQTGDPKGDGTGGESIWGGSFKDEFNTELTHEAYTVSMANIGEPNSNRSQFFITTIATPHLDMKHTVFGRVIRGQDVVQAIERVQTDKQTDKPLTPIYINSIDIADELKE